MKGIIFFFLIGLSLTYPFDPKGSLEYAKEHCDKPYPIYSKMEEENIHSGTFVSQCIHEGGSFSVMVCFEWRDENFFIPFGGELQRCLVRHGWKSSTTPPKNFEAGYPMFIKKNNIAVIFDHFEGDSVYGYTHYKGEYYCNEYIADKDDFYYFYDE